MSSMISDATRPYEGLRILDFTQVVAGPFATLQFAMLGADVIKIERREGEFLRNLKVGDTPESIEWHGRGLPARYQAVNGGKRSLTLDLQHPQAKEIVFRLAANADVVVENFRPGIMDKLGIGYASLSEINSNLVYCAISALGQTGPYRSAPGFDGKIQALSGIMALTGHPSTGPTRTGFALCDIIAGATACFGIASALYRRGKREGSQFIDVSMLEAALSFLTVEVAEATLSRQRSKLYGNGTPTGIPTADTFKTADGDILLSVNFENQIAALMKSLGLEHLLEDSRFSNSDARLENASALQQLIEEALQHKSAIEWEQILDPAGAPSASIWKIEDIINHPQILARGAMQELRSPFGLLRLAGVGFRMDGGGRLDRMAPELGAHTSEVLLEAGYSHVEIENLRRDLVV